MSAKNQFSDLTPGQRAWVLELMQEGIDMGLKSNLKMRVYKQFARCLRSPGRQFDPAKIWNSMSDSSRDHFNHSKFAQEELQAASIEDEEAPWAHETDSITSKL